jgi:hypothetical protein
MLAQQFTQRAEIIGVHDSILPVPPRGGSGI